jgi:hypothetical protein
MRQAAALPLFSLLGTRLGISAHGPEPQKNADSAEFTVFHLTPQEDQFLEEIEKAAFQFFWEQADADTGLVKDRCNTRTPDQGTVASIAATGFGLTALCIAQERGYVSFSDARERAVKTLRTLWTVMPNHRGFFYHFANIKTGERIRAGNISTPRSSIDWQPISSIA